ncbi:MAG: hypothetical protein ABI988_07325, partial [Nitrospirota bacterium]
THGSWGSTTKCTMLGRTCGRGKIPTPWSNEARTKIPTPLERGLHPTAIHDRPPAVEARLGPGHGGASPADCSHRGTGYFADPHCPWQRGIHETINGLFRQYFPTGRDVSGFTQEALDAMAWTLHTRPRQSLAFRCPAEWFTPDACEFRQYHAALVALGTGTRPII